MKTNKKFREFKSEIQKYISESSVVKSNQPSIVSQKEKEGHKILFIGSSIGKEVRDALWFIDRSFLRFEICLDIQKEEINIWKYSIQWESEDKKSIYKIMYHWDESSSESIHHPLGHLHINDYKNLRLPTGKVDFVQIFQCIEIWIAIRKNITGGKIL